MFFICNWWTQTKMQVSGIYEIQLAVYPTRANGQAETAVTTVKQSLQAFCFNLIVSFEAFQQKTLLGQGNTSNARDRNPADLLPGRSLTASNSRFRLVRKISIKNQWKKAVPAIFIIREGWNTSFTQTEDSTRTVLMSDNQIDRPNEDDVKF